MYQLVYVSASSWAMKDSDLITILEVSRRKNPPLGVTGMLLHLDHGFLQVLEGPKDAVLSVFAAIERDYRHHGVRVLVQHDVEERLFGEWSMGFDRPTAEHSPLVFEITRDVIEHAVSSEKAAEIAILLRNFYQVNAGTYAA